MSVCECVCVYIEEEDKGKGIQNRMEQVKKKGRKKKREGEVEGRICRELKGSEQIKLNYIKSNKGCRECRRRRD